MNKTTFKDFDSDPSYKTEILWQTSRSSSKSWEIIIIETPLCDNSIKDFLIKASEPASIPHVGWEIISNFGLVNISLPITNFCKLPPDKLEALASIPGVTTLNSSITFFASSVLHYKET